MDSPSGSTAVERFRPASPGDFKKYAKDLGWLIDKPLQRAQELLARMYGYADLHELQVILKRAGTAGPFDDDSDFSERARFVEGRAPRLARLLATELGIPEASPLPERPARVAQLGLFCSPKQQREMKTALVEALGEEERRKRNQQRSGWPSRLLKHLDRVYRLPWRVVAPEAGAFATMLHSVSFLQSEFNPEHMVRNARTFREPEVYLAGTAEPPSHPDLPEFDTDGIYDCGGDFMHFSYDEDDFAWNVIETIYPKYAGRQVDAPEDDDTVWNALARFQEHPSAAVAAKHPILSAIPNVTTLAKVWDAHRYRACASAWLDYRVPYSLLTDAFQFTHAGTGAETHMKLLLELEGSSDHKDMQDMSLWRYRATCLALSDSGEEATPVALLAGRLIVPFKGQYSVHPENLMVMMDAQSAFMNDVWKVLQYRYFPGDGYADVAAFCDDRPFESFITVEVEIASQWRGKGLLPEVLSMLSAMIDSAAFAQFDCSWEMIGENPDDFDDFDIEAEYELGRPTVFIFPVPGTEPKEHIVHLHDMALTYANRPPVQRPRDAKIEARKRKLSRHFFALNGTLEASTFGESKLADVIVYDPWDFPVT